MPVEKLHNFQWGNYWGTETTRVQGKWFLEPRWLLSWELFNLAMGMGSCFYTMCHGNEHCWVLGNLRCVWHWSWDKVLCFRGTDFLQQSSRLVKACINFHWQLNYLVCCISTVSAIVCIQCWTAPICISLNQYFSHQRNSMRRWSGPTLTLLG